MDIIYKRSFDCRINKASKLSHIDVDIFEWSCYLCVFGQRFVCHFVKHNN